MAEKKRKFRLEQVVDPFDFEKYPSMSSQVIKSAPSVFGGEDPNLLQTANRVMVGGPLDIFDLLGRTGDVAARGVSEGVEYATGAQGIRRDIYNMLTAAGLMAGMNPSSASSAIRNPSQRRSAPQSSTPSEGIMKALPEEAPISGEIVSGPSDKFLKLAAEKKKRITPEGKAQMDEEMLEEAFRDSFSDAIGYIDDVADELEPVLARSNIYQDSFAPSYTRRSSKEGPFQVFGDNDVSAFYDSLQDVALFRVGRGEDMGKVLREEIPGIVRSYEDQYGYYPAGGMFDTNEIIKRMAPKMKEYGIDILKDGGDK